MLVMIDNYDSFVYNLAAYFEELNQDIKVIRNDKLTIEELESIENLDGIIISPGPGRPQDGGVSLDIVRHLPENFQSWVYALGIRLSDMPLAQS